MRPGWLWMFKCECFEESLTFLLDPGIPRVWSMGLDLSKSKSLSKIAFRNFFDVTISDDGISSMISDCWGGDSLHLGRGYRSRCSQNSGIAWMGGGSDPCLDFCEGFVHMHWEPSKVIIHHPKVLFPHKSLPYSPEKIIQPHLFNIVTLKHD